MKKGLLFLISLVVCLGISFYLRQKVSFHSFDDVLELTNSIGLIGIPEGFTDEHPRNIYVDDYQNVSSFDDLHKKADIIAKVSVKSREQKYNVVETTVNVQEVYQGSCDSEIVIYEPTRFDGMGRIMTYASIPLLHEKQDYIVFLQYALPDDNKHFNYVNTCLATYPIKGDLKIKTIVLEETDSTDFKEAYASDIIKLDFSNIPEEIRNVKTVNNYYEHINQYEGFHHKVMEKYK